jgi:hypothetical protein
MDPNANLKEDLDLAQDLLKRDPWTRLDETDAGRLAELVLAEASLSQAMRQAGEARERFRQAMKKFLNP